MDTNDIEKWKDEYNDSYGKDLPEIGKRFDGTLEEQGHITRDQLEDVVEWKLANQGGRQGGNVERVNRVPDEYVRQVSEAAFLVSDPKVQLKTLSSIPGIGYATATVVLAFYDPESYAVGDRYLVDALLGEDRAMRVTDYPKLLDELRDRNPDEFDLRTVEKAYYQRYRKRHDLV